MDETPSAALQTKPAPSRAHGSGSAPTAADDRQWYLISEDRSLSLRLVSGAILCAGEDGELVVSPDHAAHATRFDIVEDELWLSCIAGRIRADGRPVTTHHKLSNGVQLHIGRTRYFIAAEINDSAPEVPLLDNAMSPGDNQLPQPSLRHLRVFYSGPLEIEEIVITEAAEVVLPGSESEAANPRPGRTGTGGTPTRAVTTKSGVPGRGRMTSLLLTGLVASAALGGWQWLSTTEGRRWVAGLDLPREISMDLSPHATLTTADSLAQPLNENHPVIVSLARLAWADVISDPNHQTFVATAKSLEPAVLTGLVREHVEHYASRLITEVGDAERLENMVMSLGPVLAPHREYRATLANLENRVVELYRSPNRDEHQADGEIRVAAIAEPSKSRHLE